MSYLARCRPYSVMQPRRESVMWTTSTLPLPSPSLPSAGFFLGNINDDSYISRDILVISFMAELVEKMTYQHCFDHECYLHKYCAIGGLSMYNKREDERQCPITSIVRCFADDLLPCQDVQTFWRRIGADPACHYTELGDFKKISPYHFAILYGKKVEKVTANNVLINRRTGTVIKFLRNIIGIESFLVGAYASSQFSEQLGLARCVAFYPELMCAEFEYVGHNLDFAIRRSRLLSRSEDRKEENYRKLIDYENVSRQISAICKRLKYIGGLVPKSLKAFNFCITKDEGKVVLCCLDRFFHKSIVDEQEGVVESLIQEINPKLYILFP